ncbi:sec-independent protein translocase TatB-like protein, putative [Medicago truncatula]|uniref:Sec-independent protein translocase TatB-like protein, putative n=1 Tax=Medicago truncatula TaxID=3880 RepID=G7ICN2_MEDTR|nr:sec-independent protein translocase TatB-like protein, putative [Medicago truncatula]
MLGFSFGEIFLLLGATAAVIGPKDLPMISRTAGRLAGRAVGYVQLARGQFDSVMQRSQVNQVHKELQETMAQLEAIRHEIGSISFINPGPSTRRHDNLDQASISNDNRKPEYAGVNNSISSHTKDSTSLPSKSLNMQSQATAYASLAQAPAVKNGSSANSTEVEDVKVGLQLIVMPVSAENTGLLPNRGGADVKGSDIVQEAILEAEVLVDALSFL